MNTVIFCFYVQLELSTHIVCTTQQSPFTSFEESRPHGIAFVHCIEIMQLVDILRAFFLVRLKRFWIFQLHPCDLKRFPAIHFELHSPSNFVCYVIVINIILVDVLHHICHVWVISLCLICTAEIFSLVFDECKSN